VPLITAPPLEVGAEKGESLERMVHLVHSTWLPYRSVVQARTLLLAADGVATNHE